MKRKRLTFDVRKEKCFKSLIVGTVGIFVIIYRKAVDVFITHENNIVVIRAEHLILSDLRTVKVYAVITFDNAYNPLVKLGLLLFRIVFLEVLVVVCRHSLAAVIQSEFFPDFNQRKIAEIHPFPRRIGNKGDILSLGIVKSYFHIFIFVNKGVVPHQLSCFPDINHFSPPLSIIFLLIIRI